MPAQSCWYKHTRSQPDCASLWAQEDRQAPITTRVLGHCNAPNEGPAQPKTTHTGNGILHLWGEDGAHTAPATQNPSNQTSRCQNWVPGLSTPQPHPCLPASSLFIFFTSHYSCSHKPHASLIGYLRMCDTTKHVLSSPLAHHAEPVPVRLPNTPASWGTTRKSGRSCLHS